MADSKSGVGLLVHLRNKIDGWGAVWRFLTGGQGVAVRMRSCRSKRQSREIPNVVPDPFDRRATTGAGCGLARACLMRGGGVFELVGQEHDEQGHADANE